jgi:hypothetical protein
MDLSVMTGSMMIFIASVFSAAVGALIANALTQMREKNRAALALYDEFHSEDMHKARVVAALYLLDENSIADFDGLWADKQTRYIYECLTRVVYFWMKVYFMKADGQLNVSLMKRMFAYQYYFWNPLLERLCQITDGASGSKTDWYMVFSDKKLNWLSVDFRGLKKI